jgi:hypothetical protein
MVGYYSVIKSINYSYTQKSARISENDMSDHIPHKCFKILIFIFFVYFLFFVFFVHLGSQDMVFIRSVMF